MIYAVEIEPTGLIHGLDYQPDYPKLSALVGGYIEAVSLQHGAVAYINEEGKLEGLPLNAVATTLLQAAGGRIGDWIAGPMIVVGEPDAEGEDTPVPPEWLKATGVLGSNPVASGLDDRADSA